MGNKRKPYSKQRKCHLNTKEINKRRKLQKTESQGSLNMEEASSKHSVMVDWSHFAVEFDNLREKHGKNKTCSFSDMTQIKQINEGWRSVYEYKCEKCGIERTMSTAKDYDKKDIKNFNTSTAGAFIMSGFGYIIQNIITNTLNMPSMSQDTFQEHGKYFCDHFKYGSKIGANKEIQLRNADQEQIIQNVWYGKKL